MSLLNLFLWFSNGLLCGVLVLVGFLNKRWKTFPIFFWLMGCYFFQFLVQFIIEDRSDTLWAWAAFLMTGVSFPIELAVLYELARNLIPPQSMLARRLAPISRNVLAVFVVSSTVLAAITPTASQVAVRRALLSLWFGQDCLEVGLLLAMLVFSTTLGIAWKHLHVGVLLGWGISCSVNILTMPLLRPPGFVSLTFFREAGFSVCALLWLWYVLRPEPSKNHDAPVLPIVVSLNQDVERFQKGLYG